MDTKLKIGQSIYELKDKRPVRKLFVSKISKTAAYVGSAKFHPADSNGKVTPFDPKDEAEYATETPSIRAMYKEYINGKKVKR